MSQMSSSGSLNQSERRYPLSPRVIVLYPGQATPVSGMATESQEEMPPVNSSACHTSTPRLLANLVSPMSRVFPTEMSVSSKKRKLLPVSKSPATMFVENMMGLPEKANQSSRRKRKVLQESLLEELQSMSPSTQRTRLEHEWTLLEKDMEHTVEVAKRRKVLEEERLTNIVEAKIGTAVREQTEQLSEKQNKIREILQKKKKSSTVTTNHTRKCCKYEYRGKAKPVDRNEDRSCVSVNEERQVDVKTEQHGIECERFESGTSPRKKRPEKSSISNGKREKANIGTDCQQNTKLENENNSSVRTDKLEPKIESGPKKFDSGQDKQKVRKNENLAQEKVELKQRNDECESKSVHNSSQRKSESSGDKRKDRSKNGTDKSQTERHRESNRNKSNSHEKSSSSSRKHNSKIVNKTNATKSEISNKDNQKQVLSNNKTDLVYPSRDSCRNSIKKSKSEDKYSINHKDKKLNSESLSKSHTSVHKLDMLPNNNMKDIIDKHKNNLDNVKHHKRKTTQDSKSCTHKSSSIINSKDPPLLSVSKNVDIKQLNPTNISEDSSREKSSHSNELVKGSSVVNPNKIKIANKQKIENGESNISSKPISVSTEHTNPNKNQHILKNVRPKVGEDSKEKNINSIVVQRTALKSSPNYDTNSSSSIRDNGDKAKVKTNESMKSNEQLKEECKKLVEKYMKNKKEISTVELQEKTVISGELSVKEDNTPIIKEKENNKKKVMNLDEYKKRKGQYLPKKTIVDDENALDPSNLSLPKANGKTISKDTTNTLMTSKSNDPIMESSKNKCENQIINNKSKVLTIEVAEKHNKMTIVNNVVIENSFSSSNSGHVTNLETNKLKVGGQFHNGHLSSVCNANKFDEIQLEKDVKQKIENKTSVDNKLTLKNLKTKLPIKKEKSKQTAKDNNLISTDKSDKLISQQQHHNKNVTPHESTENIFPNTVENLRLDLKMEDTVLIENHIPIKTIILNQPDPHISKNEEEKVQTLVENEDTKTIVFHVHKEDTLNKYENICIPSKENNIKELKTETNLHEDVNNIESNQLRKSLKPNVSNETEVQSYKKELITAPKTTQKNPVKVEKKIEENVTENDSLQKPTAQVIEEDSDATEEGEISDHPSEEEHDIKEHHHHSVKGTHTLSNKKDNSRMHYKEKEIHANKHGRLNIKNIDHGRDKREHGSKEYQTRDQNSSSTGSRERMRKRKSRSVSSSSSSSSSSSGSSRLSSSSSSSDSSSSGSSSSSSVSSKPSRKRPKQRPNSSLSKTSRKSTSSQTFRPYSRNGAHGKPKRSFDRPKESFKRAIESDKSNALHNLLRGSHGHTKRPCLLSSTSLKSGTPQGMEPLKIELHYGTNDKTPPKRCINLARPSQEVTNELNSERKSDELDESNHKSFSRDDLDQRENDLNKSHISISDTSLESENTTIGSKSDTRSLQESCVKTKSKNSQRNTIKMKNKVDNQNKTRETKVREENGTSNTHSETNKTNYSQKDETDGSHKNAESIKQTSKNRHRNYSKTPTKEKNHLSPDRRPSPLKSTQGRSRSRSVSRTRKSNSISPRKSFAENRNNSRSRSRNGSVPQTRNVKHSRSPQKASIRENRHARRRSRSPSTVSGRKESRSPGKPSQQHGDRHRTRNGRVASRLGGVGSTENHFPLHSDFVRNPFSSRRSSPPHARTYDNTLRRSRSSSPGHRKYTPIKGSNSVRVKPTYRHASSHSPSPERASPQKNPNSTENASGFPSAASRRNRSYRKRGRSSSLEARSGSSTGKDSSDSSSSWSDSEDGSCRGQAKKSWKRSLSHSSDERYSADSDSSAEWKRGIREYRTLYVGNILPSSTVEELRLRFQRFGTITDVHVVRKFFEHYAYITFKRADALRNAIERGNDPYYVHDNHLLPVVGPYYMLDYATPGYDQQNIVRRVAYQVKYADSFESTLASTMELLSRRKKQKVLESTS